MKTRVLLLLVVCEEQRFEVGTGIWRNLVEGSLSVRLVRELKWPRAPGPFLAAVTVLEVEYARFVRPARRSSGSPSRRDRDERDPKGRTLRSASGRSSGSWPGPSRRSLQELWQPRQIVGGGREGEGPSDALAAAEPGPFLGGDGLDPAKGLLDPLADALAEPHSSVAASCCR